jgi:hypothetical protein
MSTTAKTLTLKMVLAHEADIYKLELGEFESVELPAFEALSQRKHYLNLSENIAFATMRGKSVV